MSADENASILPGERLRRVREERGLSQDEVSKHLRLSMTYLRALEEDDYQKLPEPPFVKGYLRNYARFLNLPSEELARDYQQRVDALRHAEHQEQEAARDQAPRRRDWRLPALIVLVALLLVALGWWLWPKGAEAPARAPADQQEPLERESLDQEPPRAPDQSDDNFQPLPESREDPNQQEPGSGGGAAPGVEPSGREPRNGADVAGGNLTLNEATASEGEVSDEGASDEGASETVAIEGDRLEMEFSRECWIKVVDATGSTLSQGSQSPGSRVSVDGEGPFRVTLGDAGAVDSVTVNGTPADLPERGSGSVVRVTLPR